MIGFPQGQHAALDKKPGPFSAPSGKPAAWLSATPKPDAIGGTSLRYQMLHHRTRLDI
jgi:hypothetical protein